MKGYFTIFVAIGCLGPLAVLGAQKTWLMPASVDWLGKTCIEDFHLAGECNNKPSKHPCTDLSCAKKVGNHYELERHWAFAEDGYPCGPSKVCRTGVCINKPAGAMPTIKAPVVRFTCQ